ncbi:MAG: RND transporter [Acidobacteria bacterium]|nr:MAG: RND transporter [Acidobacteriota bacterium]
MDRPRVISPHRKRMRQLAYAGGGLALLIVTLGLTRLKPAAPGVDRSGVLIDTVKRGPMLREVRGLGTLVPEDVRWIPAAAEGRVERILIYPGTLVKPDSVILELSNPELELQALDAESQARQSEASYTELKVRLQSQALDQKAAAARVQADYEQAKMQADTNTELARQGLIADLTRKLSDVAARELANRNGIEQQRLAIASEAVEAQLAVQRALVEQRRAEARLRRSQVTALAIRPGIAGMLQVVPVEVGQRVTVGANLARVAVPDRLKAVIRVPENGTVTVDVALEGPLPQGARPDLTVDGTIELERLTDIVYVGRPAQAQPNGTVGLFKLDPDGVGATRVKVGLGRSSVSTIEVTSGLVPGDQVVLSDTSAWDAFDRIRLK